MMNLIILTHNISNGNGNGTSHISNIKCEMSIVSKLDSDSHIYHNPSYHDHHFITFNTLNDNSMIFIQLSECDYNHDNYTGCYYQLNITNCLASSSHSTPLLVSVSPNILNVVTYADDTNTNITYINLAFKTFNIDKLNSNNITAKSISMPYITIIIMILLHFILKKILCSLYKNINTSSIANIDNYKYSNDEWQDECKAIKSLDNDNIITLANNNITSSNNTNDSIIEEFNSIIETIPDTDDGWARLFLDIYENKENQIDANANNGDAFPYKNMHTDHAKDDQANNFTKMLPPQCWQSAEDIPKHGRVPLKKVLLAPPREQQS